MISATCPSQRRSRRVFDSGPQLIVAARFTSRSVSAHAQFHLVSAQFHLVSAQQSAESVGEDVAHRFAQYFADLPNRRFLKYPLTKVYLRISEYGR